LAFVVLAVALFASTTVNAQEPDEKDGAASADRDKEYRQRRDAMELFDQNRFPEALPLFESLAAAHPEDKILHERLAATLLNSSAAEKDETKARAMRARARTLFLRAKELGDDSNYLQTMLALIPEDGGSTPTFSSRKEVDEVMKAAEADFVRGDLDRAREGYVRALLLDPNLYEAALFAGDVFFKQGKQGSAAEWYARAVQIDPDRETAYRYWGDSLMRQNRMEEARFKFIEAVISAPYDHKVWMGLTQWADRNQVQLRFLKLDDKSKVNVAAGENGNVNITFDPGTFSKKKDDLNGAAWLSYGMGRALWQGEKFKKEFPNEPKYRHTLREEANSLHLMTAVLTEQKDFKKKQEKIDPALLELIKIDQAGLIEPFVLINRVDEGIAQDYVAYRSQHRDLLRRYLDEVVVPRLNPSQPNTGKP
jgi:tetratricopeptide (TPR) repeat protein